MKSPYKPDKLTLRLSPELADKIEEVILKQKELNPDYTKSDFGREALETYAALLGPSMRFIEFFVGICYSAGIPLDSLLGTIDVAYKCEDLKSKSVVITPKETLDDLS